MPAQDHLQPGQFGETVQQRANRIGRSVKYKGQWVNPTREALDTRRASVKSYHQSLAPAKATLKENGVSWGGFKGHITANGHLYGAPQGREESSVWIAETHDNNPEKFHSILNDYKQSK